MKISKTHLIIVAILAILFVVAWKVVAKQHIEIQSIANPKVVPLLDSEVASSILPSNATMTKERIAILRGSFRTGDCIRLTMVSGDNKGSVTVGSSISAGLGNRTGTREVELGVWVHRSYSEDATRYSYVDVVLYPSSGRIVGTGRPIKIDSVNFPFRWTERQSVDVSAETVIYVEAEKQIQIENGSSLDDLRDSVKGKFVAIVLEPCKANH